MCCQVERIFLRTMFKLIFLLVMTITIIVANYYNTNVYLLLKNVQAANDSR